MIPGNIANLHLKIKYEIEKKVSYLIDETDALEVGRE